MPDPAVAFLAQPIQMMARRGEGFTNLVIDTLRRWVASNYIETVRAQHRGLLFALSAEPSTRWHILVMRHGHKHADFGASVCGVEFGIAQEAIEHFMPLVGIDHIQPAMQVRLGKMEAKMFAALAVGQGYDVDSIILPGSRAPGRRSVGADVVAQVDAASRRWASSQARTHFKDVFDRARQQPQIVERGDDDLVVMSRTYLQELIEPTSARAMAQYYRARGIPAAGLVDLAAGVIDDLEELPALARR